MKKRKISETADDFVSAPREVPPLQYVMGRISTNQHPHRSLIPAAPRASLGVESTALGTASALDDI